MSQSEKPSTKGYSVVSELANLQNLVLDWIGHFRPLSDQELVERALLLTLSKPSINEVTRAFEYLIRFGSHGELAEEIEKRTHAPSVLPGKRQMEMSKKELTALGKRARNKNARRWWDTNIEQRLKFRWAVESIITNPRAARKELNEYMIEPALTDLVPVPRLLWDGRRVSTEIYYHCDSIDGAIAYALMLMLDTNIKLGKALRICKLESCDRIYLARPPKKGGPRPKYCQPEHKLIADQLTGAQRTARWRAKQSKKRGKKK